MRIRVAVPVSKHGKPVGYLHLAICEDGGAWAFPLCGAQLNRYQLYELNSEVPLALDKAERCPTCVARAEIMHEAAKKDLEGTGE